MQPTEVYTNLYIGNENHYKHYVSMQPDWSVVHACKEPYHRLLAGYAGKALPSTDPNYLFVKKDNRLALNMIDGPDPKYTSHELIDAAMAFANENLRMNRKVLIHCNQGQSRGPSLGLIYLLKYTDSLPKTSLLEAEVKFKLLYPSYQPMNGIRGYIESNFERIVSGINE
jgi:predicted protein tyrosine phosphatase